MLRKNVLSWAATSAAGATMRASAMIARRLEVKVMSVNLSSGECGRHSGNVPLHYWQLMATLMASHEFAGILTATNGNTNGNRVSRPFLSRARPSASPDGLPAHDRARRLQGALASLEGNSGRETGLVASGRHDPRDGDPHAHRGGRGHPRGTGR